LLSFVANRIVVRALDRHCFAGALAVGLQRPAVEVEALELPARVFLHLRALVLADRVEVSVRSAALSGRRIDLRRAIEAADARGAARLELLAGAHPAWSGAAGIDCRRFVGIGGDEVVVERPVVELDDRRADLVADDPGDSDDAELRRRGRVADQPDLAVGAQRHPVRVVVAGREWRQHRRTADAECRIERAVGHHPGDTEADGVAWRQDAGLHHVLAVLLDGDAPRIAGIAADHEVEHSARAEGKVGCAGRGQPRNDRRERAVAVAADGDDPAVGLHAEAVELDASARERLAIEAAARAECRVGRAVRAQLHDDPVARLDFGRAGDQERAAGSGENSSRIETARRRQVDHAAAAERLVDLAHRA
jgi:hypothetical protein